MNPMFGTKLVRNDSRPHRNGSGTPRTTSAIVSSTATAKPKIEVTTM
jgi:hypothetical protein